MTTTRRALEKLVQWKKKKKDYLHLIKNQTEEAATHKLIFSSHLRIN